ncbi:hypothetical protein PS467_41575 [Streptomyces luomodiensis]|uniref:Uncharacterized protein n=1 Tax=Streptomyces luomodiensis TaxID=3026192 RepID=A0ABY9V8W5_9ACTN|nr:hypothetical protein [Streptomyces sp. SCA4-21]WNF01360.1 hypothetical protein PS467_41575 [Streptomyces sp. SCA4-21]
MTRWPIPSVRDDGFISPSCPVGGHEGGAAGHLKHHQGLVLVIAYERGTAVGFGYGFPRHRRCLRVLVPEPAGDKSGDRTPSEGTPDSPWQSQRFANRIRSGTLLSTQCWKPVTAAAPSVGNST